MEDYVTLCIICGMEIPGMLPKFCDESDEKFRIYQSWTDDCAQSVCETLLGFPHFPVFLQYFQQCNFCSKCDQTIRDMYFFTNQIKIFKKRIQSLIDEIQTLLLVNLQTGVRTKDKHLQTRIITMVYNGPQSLKAYSCQQIAEIMYTIIANKVSQEEEKKSTEGLISQTPRAEINQHVNSLSNMCEAKLAEVKEEPVDDNYIEIANDHIDFQDDGSNPFPCSSSVSGEAKTIPDSIWNMPIAINKKPKKKKFKGKRKELPSRKTRNTNPVWKKADVGSDSEEEEIKKKKPFNPQKPNYWEEDVESDGSWTPPKKQIKKKIPCREPAIEPPKETKEMKEEKRQEKIRLASEKYAKRKRDKRIAKKKEVSVLCTAENCDKFFATKDEAEGHFREIHEGNTTDPYQCNHCTEKFTNYKYLQKHNNTRAQLGNCIGKEECTFCGKLYTSVEKLNEHLSTSHKGPNPFTCAFCEHETTNSLELRKHVKEHHPNLGDVVCEECGEKVYYRRLGAHKKLHSQSAETIKEELKCEICNKTYSHSNALKRHKAIIHNEGDIEILYCEVCGRGCYGKGNLSQHMRFHNNERPYKCKICDRTFKTAGHCRDHETSHIGIRNFKCETCGKLFLTSNILRGHVLIHKEGYVPRKFNRRTKPVRRSAAKKRSDSESPQKPPVKNEEEESLKSIDIKEDQPIQQGTIIEHHHNSQPVPFETVDANDIYVPNIPVHYIHHPQPYYHPPFPYTYNPNPNIR